VLTELRQRGVQDVLVCCVDGLEGFPGAIEAVFPKAWVQTCIAHLIRSSLRFVPDKDRRQVARDLKRSAPPQTATTPGKSSSASPRSGTPSTR
jgi:putative transposase